MNPVLTSGQTNPNVTYQVIKDTDGRFPITVGGMFKSSVVKTIDNDHTVRPSDDTTYYYRQTVAKVDNGSCWYVLKAVDADNEDIVLVSSSAEGQIRDWNGRLFSFKESGSDVVVKEEIVLKSTTPKEYAWSVKFARMYQDVNGYIFAVGYNTKYNGVDNGLFKMKFI
jgi:hypothetical protein